MKFELRTAYLEKELGNFREREKGDALALALV